MEPSNASKNKRTTKCDKKIVTFDVGTTQCEDGTGKCEDVTVKCEKKK